MVATDTFSGQRSSTMVTVLLAGLTVNPLLHVCYFDDQLNLTAGTLEGELRWTVVGAGEAGRGSVRPDADGRRCAYTAGSLIGDSRTYVLDQVLVENTQTGETASIYVLVRQRRPELVVEIATQLPTGGLQLQGKVNGQVMPDVQWALPIDGTGSVDASGRYLPPDDELTRFALITAKWEIDVGGVAFIFEGHLSLPLPLTTYFDALRRIQQPAGLRTCATEHPGE